MARRIRVQFAGAVYHVMARGNERREIFRDDKDRQRFLETLGGPVMGSSLSIIQSKVKFPGSRLTCHKFAEGCDSV
jgi:hypothetical protein